MAGIRNLTIAFHLSECSIQRREKYGGVGFRSSSKVKMFKISLKQKNRIEAKLEKANVLILKQNVLASDLLEFIFKLSMRFIKISCTA
jgi:hypothetical protein